MHSVDVLDYIGLRSGNFSSEDASLTTGPTGMLDAFMLERQLNESTTGLEWQVIGEDFPDQFGLYTIFNASDYEGSIISVRNGSAFAFDISLRRDVNSSDDILFVTLPGLETLRITIPASAGLRGSQSFSSLGVRLTCCQLLVLVNCVVVNFVDLPEPYLPLPVFEGEVSVFDDEAVVSKSNYMTL